MLSLPSVLAVVVVVGFAVVALVVALPLVSAAVLDGEPPSLEDPPPLLVASIGPKLVIGTSTFATASSSVGEPPSSSNNAAIDRPASLVTLVSARNSMYSVVFTT